MKDKQMPAKELVVRIGVNDYTIKFPKTSQLIDIESAKIRMTGGTNKEMIHGSPLAVNAYMSVEAVATFETLLPQMVTDLNVKSLLDLDMQQIQAVTKEYEKYFLWMSSWRDALSDIVEEKEEKKSE